MQSEVAKLEVLHYYATRFQRLRVDRAHGVAPHKPILLLAVIELIALHTIAENRIELSSQLNRTFLKYWSYLGSAEHNPDIARPFFHMKSGKFWHLVPNNGFEKILNQKIKLKTFSEVKQAINYAYLDEDLFDFLQETKSRESLLAVLVSRWFPGQFEEIKQISENQEFRDPPIYLQEAHLKYLDRLDNIANN